MSQCRLLTCAPYLIGHLMTTGRRARTAAETDCFEARRWYCYLQRAGACAKIKRQARRRERREGKRLMRDQSP
jgi:hypothetical protein